MNKTVKTKKFKLVKKSLFPVKQREIIIIRDTERNVRLDIPEDFTG